MNQKFLSICIPTRDRINILKNTLDSIYNSKVDLSEYEVVIYDSSNDNELAVLLASEYKYPNLIYQKGENHGFLNLISSLKMGNGLFLKLHNDYTSFSKYGLEKMLLCIKNELPNESVVFFSNGILLKKGFEYFQTFDTFLYNISFYSSWATAFGIWKSDFNTIKDIEINPMFPHTSLLFALYNKNSYLVNDEELFINEEVSKKGGYNLFYTFAVTYIKMVAELSRHQYISKKTFIFIKADLYKRFLIIWYYNTKIKKNEYTFELSQIKESMQVHYSILLYYKMVFSAYFYAFKNLAITVLKNKHENGY